MVKQLKEGRFILMYSLRVASITEGEMWQWEQERTGHFAPPQSGSREKWLLGLLSLSSFVYSRIPNQHMVPSSFRVVLPSPVKTGSNILTLIHPEGCFYDDSKCNQADTVDKALQPG